MKVTLISHTNDPEKVVATAAKLCYSNNKATELFDQITSDEASSFIIRLSKMGHQSPLEHASFTFAIEGVSRSLLAQITRHRIASFSVQSQRYVDMSDNFEPVLPKDMMFDEEVKSRFHDIMESISGNYHEISLMLTKSYFRKKYESLIKEKELPVPYSYFESSRMIELLIANLGIEGEEKKKAMKKDISAMKKRAIENARAILPNACPTQMIVTMNARELLHFFNERCCNRAQEEIRELAWRMLVLVKEVAPSIFVSAGPSCLCGSCKEGPMTCGLPYQYSKNGEELYQINYTTFSLSEAPGYVPTGLKNRIRIIGGTFHEN